MFLKANTDNGIIAEVIGGRKRENGLVVPCLYKCRSKNKKCINTHGHYTKEKYFREIFFFLVE